MEGHLEAPVGQVPELLARVPEALTDVPCELLREDNLHDDEVAADDAEGASQILLRVEARRQSEPAAQNVQAANAFHREDANGAPQVAVTDEVQPSIEVGQVVRIDLALGLLVALERVVLKPQAAVLDERALDSGQMLGRGELELGAEGAHA